MAADEIERFRREIVERTGDARAGDNITDQELLREVMNTVGKHGQLGGAIRCVVSVSMLTEGWDANTVTHVLGVRAFGTQLLCEQVIGRALRRQSYDLNEEGLFNVEYADVLGIPFDFTAKPVVAPPQPPRETVQVKAVRPERDALEIRFPRVEGYRVELPEERLTADFNDDSILELTPDLVGPSDHAELRHHRRGRGPEPRAPGRHAAVARSLFHLTQRLLYTKWRDPGEEPKLHLFGQLKRITKQWLDTCLVCKGGTYPAQLMYQELADMACNRITAGITRAVPRRAADQGAARSLQPHRLDRARPLQHLARPTAGRPTPRRCHVNWVVLDSDWEAEFCRVAESHPQVRAYVKNHNLGLEVPYRYGSETRKYLPDFIVLVDDGHGDGRPAAPRRRDQGLPARGREGEEVHDGHLLGAWREPSRHLRPLGVRRVHRRVPDRVRLRGQGRKRVQQDDRRPSRRSRRRREANHGQEAAKHEDRRDAQARRGQAEEHPDRRVPVRAATRSSSSRCASRYDRATRDLDPQLVWRGKDEQDWSDLVVHAPPLYIQEKVHPKVLIDDLLRADARSASTTAASCTPDLFADFNGIPKGVDKTEFYQHDQNWSNRMILGDSLQVMASLAEREGLRGKVQCIYFDPPYGIKFNSNFQWSTTSRDVKDGNADHITREPEQVKAFRDTWRDGIHSYLTYLRDRLTVARDLLTDSGSIFVQIGDENVHRVRALMDEVFGDENFVSPDCVHEDDCGLSSELLAQCQRLSCSGMQETSNASKYRQLYSARKRAWIEDATRFTSIRPDGTHRSLTTERRRSRASRFQTDARVLRIEQPDVAQACDRVALRSSSFEGSDFTPGQKTLENDAERAWHGLRRLIDLMLVGNSSALRSILRRLSVSSRSTTSGLILRPAASRTTRCTSFRRQPRVIRALHPDGHRPRRPRARPDLRFWHHRLLSPSNGAAAGSRSTPRAWRWRWPAPASWARAIRTTCWPIPAKASSRKLKSPAPRRVRSPSHGNIRHGFVYERVPHITLKSIANNAEIDVIWEQWQAKLEPLREKLNAALKKQWQEWEIPREADAEWPDAAKKLHADWWQARIARQKEIDASIAAKAEFEYLYDKPYEDKKKVRVAGPFTVESLSPAPRARRGRERRTDRRPRRRTAPSTERKQTFAADDPGEPQDRRRPAGAQGRPDHLHRRSRPGRASSSAPRAATSKARPRSAPPSSSAPSSAPCSAPTWSPPPARRATPASTC